MVFDFIKPTRIVKDENINLNEMVRWYLRKKVRGIHLGEVTA